MRIRSIPIWRTSTKCNLHFVAVKTIIKQAIINTERENKMSKNSIVQLIIAIIAFGLFLMAWLVFKNIKTSDWIILLVGVLDLIVFFLGLKKNKENKQ